MEEASCRFGGIAWCDDDLALVYEGNWETRRSRVWTFRPADPGQPQKLLFDRNYEDIYTDPGSPLGVRHPQYATDVLARVDGGNKLLMQGPPLELCLESPRLVLCPAARLIFAPRRHGR